jgi:S-DNA-T family DNA segregation ATPase FtsK/SpoIIIE
VFIPNKQPQVPKFLDLAGVAWNRYHKPEPGAAELKVPLMLGMNWKGDPAVFDLAEQPHVLVAGATGGGKSNMMRALICSIVYIVNSSAVRIALSDTKGGIEFGIFDKVPHLLYPRAVSAYQTVEQWEMLSKESEERLKHFADFQVTNIHEFNAKVKPELRMPYIVGIVDELADVLDLGKIATKHLDMIVRRSRAAGIYMIAGTQRPSVSVVAGQIKANFPARLSFRTGSMADSRVVLDMNGAEELLEKGDMLFKPGTGASLYRLHAPLARPEDVKAVIDLILFTNEQLGVTK